jgi:hypothetical protein
LYAIPLLVYLFQFYFDITTVFKTGDVLGRGKMWVLVVTSTLFGLLIVGFTIWCWTISTDIDQTWDEAALRTYGACGDVPEGTPQEIHKPRNGLCRIDKPGT